jgi:hypothetical protein
MDLTSVPGKVKFIVQRRPAGRRPPEQRRAARTTNNADPSGPLRPLPLCAAEHYILRGLFMSHIFTANLSHSSDAWIGVGLIGVYFVWMLYMALMRISKGEHLHH